jgi:hypothetical protein
VIELRDLTPAAEEGWWLLLELMAEQPESCMVVGGQMMYLLAAEHRAGLPRPTDDVDVVVNVQLQPRGTEWLADWLVARGLEMGKPSADGIGHRFARASSNGPGQVVFDVLAPSWTGRQRVALTRPPARTVQAPGSTSAFARSELVAVAVSGMTGHEPREGRVRRPDLLGALVMKAAGIKEIHGRTNPSRDWQDVALLLSMLPDPHEASTQCDRNDRRRLRDMTPLLERDHVGWLTLDDDAFRRGSTTLEFLIG